MSFRIALRFTLSSSNKWALPGRCSYRQSLATARPEHLRHSSSSSKRPTVGQTDDSVRVQYPEDADLPATRLTQGRGGQHYKRTLATFSLEKRVVVVTGGARGLGLVMSQAIIASGADVALVDINASAAAESASRLVEGFNEANPEVKKLPKVTAHYADVSDPESVSTSMEDIIEQHGKVDGLVTSAGFTENYDALSYPFDRVKKLWGVNVDGTYLFATAVARHLTHRNAPGSIAMIGSMSGSIVNVPQPQTPYNASKAAVRHLAASLAVEWAPNNIRVNCISPGYMLTALTKKILDDNPQLRSSWTSRIPQGDLGRPEDLMVAVVFLLSDASRYMTGADLRIDGGYTVV